MKHLPFLACTALLASGCAERAGSPYPSLLPRPIESRSSAEPIAVPVPAATPDAATEAELAAFRSALNDAATAFAPAADRTEQAAIAAKGDAAGGERWIAAESALAELDGYRATTSSTLTDLEELAIERAADNAAAYPAIEALRTVAEAQLTAESARIAAIQAMLPAA
jgi:hypothetical protein